MPTNINGTKSQREKDKREALADAFINASLADIDNHIEGLSNAEDIKHFLKRVVRLIRVIQLS